MAVQQQPGAIVQQTGDWQNGLCECFGDCGQTIVTCCCPCITYGNIAEGVGKNCCMCGCMYVILSPFYAFTGGYMRGQVRNARGIPGGSCGDFVTHFCCHCCAMVQEIREVKPKAGTAVVVVAPQGYPAPAPGAAPYPPQGPTPPPAAGAYPPQPTPPPMAQ